MGCRRYFLLSVLTCVVVHGRTPDNSDSWVGLKDAKEALHTKSEPKPAGKTASLAVGLSENLSAPAALHGLTHSGVANHSVQGNSGQHKAWTADQVNHGSVDVAKMQLAAAALQARKCLVDRTIPPNCTCGDAAFHGLCGCTCANIEWSCTCPDHSGYDQKQNMFVCNEGRARSVDFMSCVNEAVAPPVVEEGHAKCPLYEKVDKHCECNVSHGRTGACFCSCKFDNKPDFRCVCPDNAHFNATYETIFCIPGYDLNYARTSCVKRVCSNVDHICPLYRQIGPDCDCSSDPNGAGGCVCTCENRSLDCDCPCHSHLRDGNTIVCDSGYRPSMDKVCVQPWQTWVLAALVIFGASLLVLVSSYVFLVVRKAVGVRQFENPRE